MGTDYVGRCHWGAHHRHDTDAPSIDEGEEAERRTLIVRIKLSGAHPSGYPYPVAEWNVTDRKIGYPLSSDLIPLFSSSSVTDAASRATSSRVNPSRWDKTVQLPSEVRSAYVLHFQQHARSLSVVFLLLISHFSILDSQVRRFRSYDLFTIPLFPSVA